MGNSVIDYFKGKAAAYDDVDQQNYWVLSDKLLWEAFEETALKRLPEGFTFLDAGGGTGRWSAKILTAYSRAFGTIRDISPDMLAQAALKREALGHDRLNIITASVQRMGDIPDKTFDLVFNFHNVIGFLNDPFQALIEMYRILKPGGFLVTVAPSQYHMTFFSLFMNQIDWAEEVVANELGRFTKDMPSLKGFRPEQLKDWYSQIGLKDTACFGFPLFIYPGFQETQLHGSSKTVADVLSSPEAVERIYRLERRFLFSQTAAARGNNLFVVGRKE